jgi:hypothetical protein
MTKKTNEKKSCESVSGSRLFLRAINNHLGIMYSSWCPVFPPKETRTAGATQIKSQMLGNIE